MPDAGLIAARLVLYASLACGFGLPLFALRAWRDPMQATMARRVVRLTGTAVVVALVASCIGFWWMARGMSDATDAASVGATVHMLLLQTQVGKTSLGRAAMLLIASILCVVPIVSFRRRFMVLAWLGAGSLATLAWVGHGAMSDGGMAWLHLAVDIAHLLAAGAWFGALVALLVLTRQASNTTEQRDVDALVHAASGFARLGSLIVATLIVSGVINYLLIVGPSLSGWIYGRGLLIKLGMFAGMLLLAASHRFRLVPALERAMRAGSPAKAVMAWQRSLWLETGLAVLILAIVSWLGTLDPSN